MNKIDLAGRCAVVTGGAQGFGRAVTERFVASGAKVAIWDHDQALAEKTAKTIGSAVIAMKVDDLEKTIAELREKGIRLVGDPGPGNPIKGQVFVHPSVTGGVLTQLVQR